MSADKAELHLLGAFQKLKERHLFALSCILLLAFIMRAWDLRHESVWTDEFLAQVLDPTLDFSGHLALNRHRMPDNMPLYYSLLWLFGQLGLSVYSQRLFSVLIGTFTCLVVWLTGKNVGGVRVAHWSAFFYAMSPYFAHHDQALRPYALVILLSALSIYSMLEFGKRGQNRNLLINTAINAVGIWVHVCSAFLLIPLGVYLLTFLRSRPRAVITWGLVNFLASLTVFLVMIPPPPEPLYKAADLRLFMQDLVGDDLTGWNQELLLSSNTLLSKAFSEGAGAWLLDGVNYAMAAWLLAAIAAGVFYCVRRAVAGDAHWRNKFLMLCIVLLPAFAMSIFSYANEPMYLPRYTVFSSIALYVLAASFLEQLPRKIQVASVLLLISASSLNGILAMVEDTRTQWSRVIELINEQSQPGDLVLFTRHPDNFLDAQQSRDTFLYNQMEQGVAMRVCTYLSHELGALEAQLHLRALPTGQRGAVWFVVQCNYDASPIERLEESLADAGLSFERWKFAAMQGIILYKATLLAGAQSGASNAYAEDDCKTYLKMLDGYGIVPEDELEMVSLCESMGKIFNGQGVDTQHPALIAALSWRVGDADPALALRLAERAVSLDNNSGCTLLALGVAQLQLGMEANAADSFGRCLRAKHDYYPIFFERLLQALSESDLEVAVVEARKVLRAGGYLPSGLMRELGVIGKDNCATLAGKFE